MDVLVRVLRSRVVARAAIGALAVGIIALAGLAMWSSETMDRASTEVEALNEVNDAWGRVFQHVNLEDDAMREYLNTPTKVAHERLANAAGQADGDLQWLRDNGGEENNLAATRVGQIYADYTASIKEMLLLGDRGETTNAALQSGQAYMASASVRKQVALMIERKRLATTEHMQAAREHNRRIRMATIIAFAVDLCLLGICSVVLVGYQRRIERQAARSQHDALHDSLTGLPNRVLLAERTSQAVREADRYEEMPGLLLIDLDRFKEVNDTLGHPVGDVLLKEVAARLVGAVREVDTVARLGGDEFAVLLPRVGSVENATMVADRIQAAFVAPMELNGITLEIAGSIGVALYPLNAGSPDEMMRHADVAMYQAKRDQIGVAVFEPSLDEASAAPLNLVSALRRAIEHGELVLHYQPKAMAGTGEICGVEALVRWQHPERGLLAPMEFIPVAEQNGLIEPLTSYVLRAALEQSRRWIDAGIELPMSVNIGAQSLRNEAFATEVVGLLAANNVPAWLLMLEITENALVTDPDRASRVLRALEDAGVRLSIDDFGTGYSSIAYLRTLQVHEMKLDREFVTRMLVDTGNHSIVRAMLDLARDFQLQVVAEGVEDRETWTALNDLGCDIVQGFYLSKPLPEEELTNWLLKQDLRQTTPAAAGASLNPRP